MIPLRSDFRGRIPGIVHDQSASGATLFIEPLATVELNNQWRELQLQEQRRGAPHPARTERPGGRFGRAPIAVTVETLARLDLAFAKARYSHALRAIEPTLISLDEAVRRKSEDASWRLRRASSSGCAARAIRCSPPETVVPIDVELGGDFSMLLITGPNTGGKTVALKTVGLLSLMAQAGLHLPVREDSAVAGLRRRLCRHRRRAEHRAEPVHLFLAHDRHRRHPRRTPATRTLVLLDELGAGTDPVEGSALARALLSHLLARRAPVVATTHYSELKVYAYNTPGVENASVEFDVETLAPTYQLTIGLPGRSNAFAIARRLGLAAEIIDSARDLVSDNELQTDEMLGNIKTAREEALADREAARAIMQSAQRLERELRDKNARRSKAPGKRSSTPRAKRRRASSSGVRKQLRQLSERLASDALTRIGWRETQGPDWTRWPRACSRSPLTPPPPRPRRWRNSRVGDTVWVPSLAAKRAS